MRTIVIVCRDSEGSAGEFDVHEGTAFLDRLCWDELLGTIAVLTHPTMNKVEPRIPPYRLRSIDTVRETERELRCMVRDLQEKLSKQTEQTNASHSPSSRELQAPGRRGHHAGGRRRHHHGKKRAG